MSEEAGEYTEACDGDYYEYYDSYPYENGDGEDVGGSSRPHTNTQGEISAVVHTSPTMETVNRGVILQALQDTVHTFAELFALSEPAAAIILNELNWPLEPAEIFLAHREDTLKKAALKEADLVASPHTIVENETTIAECPVCFDAIAPHDGLALSACRHFAHRGCWQSHLRSRGEQGMIVSTRCILCRDLIGFDNMSAICDGAEETCVTAIKRAYLSNYINLNPRLSVCTSATCTGVVRVLQPLPQMAVLHCDLCGAEWCRHCRGLPHAPARCACIEEWNSSNVADGASLAFIAQITKLCPRCHRHIEKNTGCNHMTCRQPCGYEFCWICMGDWKAHASGSAYTCSRPVVVVDDHSTQRAKDALLRSYFESISSHRRSAEFETKLITDFLSETRNNVTDVYTPLFVHLRSSLVKARSMIWNSQISTYIRKLHLINEQRASECNAVTHMEFRCGQVEGATEELSKLLDLCIGTKSCPGVLRGDAVDPDRAEEVLALVRKSVQRLDGWCESVVDDAL